MAAVALPRREPGLFRPLLFVSLVLALLSCGYGYAECQRAWEPTRHAGWKPTLGQLPTLLRAYLSDEGDTSRYFSYCQAMLGRPYLAAYVRPLSAWEEAYRHGDPHNADLRQTLVTPGGPQVPYRDYLVEYPPGFFLWALPPALFTRTADGYRMAFAAEMGLLWILTALLAARLLAPARQGELLWAFGWAALLLGAVVTHRYDPAAALLLCAAFVALREGRPAAAGVALGLGIATKLTPALAALPLGLFLLRRDGRALAVAAGSALASCALVVLPFAAWAGPHLADLLRYHGQRPLQVESLPAALLVLGSKLVHHPIAFQRSFGSDNVIGAGAHLLGAAAAVAFAGGLAWVAAAQWRRMQGTQDERQEQAALLSAAVAVFTLFLVTSKVFSAQYLIWILPLALPLCLQQPGRVRALCLLYVTLGLTQVIFPAAYGSLEALTAWGFSLVLVRNLLLMALARQLWRASAQPPAPQAARAAAAG